MYWFVNQVKISFLFHNPLSRSVKSQKRLVKLYSAILLELQLTLKNKFKLKKQA